MTAADVGSDDGDGEASGDGEVVEPEVDESEDERGQALAPFDPLQRYLTEIRRYPLLTREEEKRARDPLPRARRTSRPPTSW